MTIAELAAHHTGVAVEDVDRDEVLINIDKLAKRYLKIDGPTFLAEREMGKYDDAPDEPALQRVLAAAELLG